MDRPIGGGIHHFVKKFSTTHSFSKKFYSNWIIFRGIECSKTKSLSFVNDCTSFGQSELTVDEIFRKLYFIDTIQKSDQFHVTGSFIYSYIFDNIYQLNKSLYKKTKFEAIFQSIVIKIFRFFKDFIDHSKNHQKFFYSSVVLIFNGVNERFLE